MATSPGPRGSSVLEIAKPSSFQGANVKEASHYLVLMIILIQRME
jgi:hypothetical protein